MTDQRRDDIRKDGASVAKRGHDLMESLLRGLKFYSDPASRAAFAAGFFGRDGAVADLEAMRTDLEMEAVDQVDEFKQGFDQLTTRLNGFLDERTTVFMNTLCKMIQNNGLDNPVLSHGPSLQPIGSWIENVTDGLLDELVDDLRTKFHEIAKSEDLE